MKKLLVILALVGVALVAAAYWVTPSQTPKGEESFGLTPVERGTLTETVSATGNIQPQVVVVGSELSGKVVKLYPGAEYNQEVKKGDPLLDLDPQMANLTLDQAQKDLQKANLGVTAAENKREAAQKALEARKDLAAKEIGSDRDVQQAEFLLKAAEAELQAAKLTVDQAQTAVDKAKLGLNLTTVKAPAGGTVLERKVYLGQLVAPPLSGHLFTLVTDLAEIHFHAQVAEGDVSKIRPGQKAQVKFYAYADLNQPFEGKVEDIRQMPTSLQGPVFYDTIVVVKNRRNPDPKYNEAWMLRPGMTASVEILRRSHEDVWKMPMAALNFQLDEHFQTEPAKAKLRDWQNRKDHNDWQPVWILRDKKPWPIFVRTGTLNAEGETEGISDGQFKEVFQWDPDLQPDPDPKNPATVPQVIITAPPPRKSGLFDQVKLKIS